MVRGIFRILDNEAKWKEDLPSEFGPKSTMHDWFHRWAEAGSVVHQPDFRSDICNKVSEL